MYLLKALLSLALSQPEWTADMARHAAESSFFLNTYYIFEFLLT